MDERQLEQGCAHLRRGLDRVLRFRYVTLFKLHVAAHPGQAGRLSHCVGLSDELAAVEMYRVIPLRSALEDLHPILNSPA